ncbi:helix-turn-helix domain-containing protein [Pontibacter cellulosilyticus]|uniref:Helix-turn-helix transcriptional regulator n=1 Tax=Pontibacter cellulosilyticus TaxID=1720253 RepID=A0A923N5Z5_9BACT|nr:AraC family transcriptional regulator [Pontibacter cellulosilyticus]MBC5991532.1 helix-turn-helix transcriptional regulator [Pontibacter cellulosilyticus]
MATDFFRFDWFTAILLVGVVQGFFLALLFMAKRPHRQPYHHLLLAALVFCFACLLLEIFLCYSGLMFRTLSLVDFSEPLNFAVGPLTYLLFRSLIGKNFKARQWLHLLPFGLYIVYHLLFNLQPEAVKYNAYISAYFPELTQLNVTYSLDPDPLFLSAYTNVLTVLHVFVYLALSFLLLRRQLTAEASNPYFYSWARLLLLFFAATLLLLVVVKLSYERDLGDHLLALFLVMQLFYICYKLLTSSGFFQPVVKVKYEKSALSEKMKQDLLQKLRAAEQEKFYTKASASLPALAKQLHTSPHYLSQALNECLGKTFFEYLAELRIYEAKSILADSSYQHLKIEEVAEQTGYISKSAFSAAFKKQTGQTPGEYRKKAILS